MEVANAVAIALVPPLCAACGRACRPEAVLCNRCGRRLTAADPLLTKGPAGVEKGWASAPPGGGGRDLGGGLEVPRPASGGRPVGGKNEGGAAPPHRTR